jgi:hypothetical protein
VQVDSMILERNAADFKKQGVSLLVCVEACACNQGKLVPCMCRIQQQDDWTKMLPGWRGKEATTKKLQDAVSSA